MSYELFTQVVLKEDLPKYNLKKGNVATIVEHYPRPEGEEDGYSLEGFEGIVNDTVEVRESQIESLEVKNKTCNDRTFLIS
ncbi:DUF4926 domain-containing protein [[Phormidium ambiguum] IAM M-71]|uniref:DUF4926 domain-containing protein n=1 Tax=[Phormidium ambiguum] IAM M-71 TaxID=454136 RepID=A0A1U7ISD1_9CYAN|nr:DUF4926 domain-containing protein [Phormidium ambiguum]OKH40358.1 DUF4926 domain-containing protein [Phormidium ambiguum IAM M-71]